MSNLSQRKTLSRYGSRTSQHDPQPKEESSSDEEYGEVDKGFNINSIEYPMDAIERPHPKPHGAPYLTHGHVHNAQPYRAPSPSRPMDNSAAPSYGAFIDPYTGRPIPIPINPYVEPVDEAEVANLMSRGYTREQAEEISRRKSDGVRSRSNSASGPVFGNSSVFARQPSNQRIVAQPPQGAWAEPHRAPSPHYRAPSPQQMPIRAPSPNHHMHMRAPSPNTGMGTMLAPSPVMHAPAPYRTSSPNAGGMYRAPSPHAMPVHQPAPQYRQPSPLMHPSQVRQPPSYQSAPMRAPSPSGPHRTQDYSRPSPPKGSLGHERGAFFADDEPVLDSPSGSYSYGKQPDFNNQGMLRVNTDNQYNPAIARSHSQSAQSPMMKPPIHQQRPSLTAKSPSHNPAPVPVHQPPRTEEEEALRVAMIISKQEAEFGVNMYDTLVDDDEPVLKQYISIGLSVDEAILKVFEDKGYSSKLHQTGTASSGILINSEEIEFVDEEGNTIELVDEFGNPIDLGIGPTHNGPPPAPPAPEVPYYMQMHHQQQPVHPNQSNHSLSRQPSQQSIPVPPSRTASAGGSRAPSPSVRSPTPTSEKGLKKQSSFSSLKNLFGLGGSKEKIKLEKTREEKQMQKTLRYRDADVITLMQMGFSKEQAVQALIENQNNVTLATNTLLLSTR